MSSASAFRTASAAAVVVALAVVAWPADSFAQAAGRRAVPRQQQPVRTRPVIVRTRPVVYGSWFWGPYGWYPWGYPYGRYPYVYAGQFDTDASVRIVVPQREAEVYVDGYYAGIVDDFDGVFQRLHVEPGEHEIALFLRGFQLVSQRVYLQPRATFRIEYTMEPLGPGDPEPVRPEPSADAVRLPAIPDGVPAGAPPIVEQPITPRVDLDTDTAARFGTLALQVQPADAEILVDGDAWQRSGAVPRLLLELTAGRHQVEVRRQGYVTYLSGVVIEAGGTTPLNISLSPAEPLQ